MSRSHLLLFAKSIRTTSEFSSIRSKTICLPSAATLREADCSNSTRLRGYLDERVISRVSSFQLARYYLLFRRFNGVGIKLIRGNDAVVGDKSIGHAIGNSVVVPGEKLGKSNVAAG
jgi:hypothetical protein